MHQVNPYNFLNNLIKKAKNVLIVELRSRDVGATENDVKKSYQKVDDVLLPYIVLNYDELKNFLIKNDKCKNSRIIINRNYKILGGQNSRHLPRELSEKIQNPQIQHLLLNLETIKIMNIKLIIQ